VWPTSESSGLLGAFAIWMLPAMALPARNTSKNPVQPQKGRMRPIVRTQEPLGLFLFVFFFEVALCKPMT
jgi:hypothetical protein